MEWSKYVLSVMVGGCLLVLYGKKGTGRNKWLFGAGTGTSLMAMELAVEYMLNKAAWEMALSIMKGGAIFSVIVLLGFVRECFRSGRNLPEDKELLHPVRQWMKEYQESFLQLSRSFCMTPQPVEGLDRGERLLQLRLAENRMADFMPVFQMEWGQDFRPVPRASWCLICWNSFWKPDFPRKRRFA